MVTDSIDSRSRCVRNPVAERNTSSLLTFAAVRSPRGPRKISNVPPIAASDSQKTSCAVDGESEGRKKPNSKEPRTRIPATLTITFPVDSTSTVEE